MSILYVQSIREALFSNSCCGKIRSLCLRFLNAIPLRFPLKRTRGLLPKPWKAYSLTCSPIRHTYKHRPDKHCPQTLCFPIITVCCAVAFSSGGQIKHRLWRELLLPEPHDTLFQRRLFSTRPSPLLPQASGHVGLRMRRVEASNMRAKPTRVRPVSLNHFALH